MAISQLRILCGTWNVNGKPCKEDLSPWLRVPADDGPSPDLVAVGLQEEDLRPEAYLHIDETRLNGWRAGIESVLTAMGDYVEVACCQLVGMVILVYSTRLLCAHISDVDTAMVGCGYGGVMGNKGAVGVRFVVGATGLDRGRTLCFINSHLNAHAHNVKRRQEDYETICARMVFFSEQPLQAVTPPQNLETLKSLIAHDTEDAGPTLGSSLDLTTPTTPTQPRMPAAAPAPTAAVADDADGLRPLEHDMVIWLGDLNYRLDLEREDILRAAERGDWDTLHDSDQLRREMAAGNVFHGFHEAPPRYWPTYKFDSGTDRYDTSAKQRVPALCDRVVWRVSGNPANHRAHRPASQTATPPLPFPDSPGGGTSSGSGGIGGGAVGAGGANASPRASGPAPMLSRAQSALTILPGTGTAKHVNPSLSGPGHSSAGAAGGAGVPAVAAAAVAAAAQRRPGKTLTVPGARPLAWRPADVATLFYRMHKELKVSDHKPVSALLVVDLGWELGVRDVDEDALETREGSRIARRVQTGGRKKHPLLLVAAGLARAAVRSYPFWLGVGAITALLVYYAWRR